MDESTMTEAPTVMLGARFTPAEREELRARVAAFRRQTGRRLTLSDVMREGALAHARALPITDDGAARLPNAA